MRFRVGLVVVLFGAGAGAGACAFELTGAGPSQTESDGSSEASGTAVGDAGPGTSASITAASADGSSVGSAGPDASAGSGAPATGGPEDSSDEGEPTSATAEASSSTGAPFDCGSGESFADLHTVSEAIEVDGSMNIDPAWGGLPGPPEVAWSAEPGAGTITFQVEVPCERTYYLWGLTWDQIHGVNNCSGVTNADAFMVAVDGGAEIQWSYGCQGCSNADAVWTWTIVHAYEASGCVTSLWPVPLTAGTHTVRFRNLDAGDFGLPTSPNVAAIAAMAISDDMAFVPMWP